MTQAVLMTDREQSSPLDPTYTRRFENLGWKVEIIGYGLQPGTPTDTEQKAMHGAKLIVVGDMSDFDIGYTPASWCDYSINPCRGSDQLRSNLVAATILDRIRENYDELKNKPFLIVNNSQQQDLGEHGFARQYSDLDYICYSSHNLSRYPEGHDIALADAIERVLASARASR